MEPQIKAAAGDVDAHTLRAGFGLPFREALRLLRVVAGQGFPALVLS
jgi:hypothetical protein